MSDTLRTELARVASRLGADGIDFVLERPRDAGHGDLATNLALVLAKRERANPRKTAERVLQELQLSPTLVSKTESKTEAKAEAGAKSEPAPKPEPAPAKPDSGRSRGKAKDE